MNVFKIKELQKKGKIIFLPSVQVFSVENLSRCVGLTGCGVNFDSTAVQGNPKPMLYSVS